MYQMLKVGPTVVAFPVRPTQQPLLAWHEAHCPFCKGVLVGATEEQAHDRWQKHIDREHAPEGAAS